MALVNVSDLEHLTLREFGPTEAAAASVIIGWVTAELESHLERSIEEAARVETINLIAVDVMAPVYVAVGYTPIKSVASVVLDGTALATSDYLVDRSGIVLYIRGFTTTSLNRSVVISYVGGLGEPARTQLAGVVARRCMRLLNKRGDDAIGAQTGNVEGYDITFLGEGWTEDEQKIVSRWRRAVGATFPLGAPASDFWSY